MERRSFVKNIGALKKEVFHDLVLKSSIGEIKMKLLEIEMPMTQMGINMKAVIISGSDTLMERLTCELIYKPDKNTAFSAQGYVVNYSIRGSEIEFEFKVAGPMTST